MITMSNFTGHWFYKILLRFVIAIQNLHLEGDFAPTPLVVRIPEQFVHSELP